MDGKKPLRDIFIKLDSKTKTMLLIKMLRRETFCGNTCGWNVSEVHLKLVVRTKFFFLIYLFIEIKLITLCFIIIPSHFYYLHAYYHHQTFIFYPSLYSWSPLSISWPLTPRLFPSGDPYPVLCICFFVKTEV